MNPSPGTDPIATDFEFAALAQARNYRDALVRQFRPHLRGRTRLTLVSYAEAFDQ